MESLGSVSLYVNEEDLEDAELLDILIPLVRRNLHRSHSSPNRNG